MGAQEETAGVRESCKSRIFIDAFAAVVEGYIAQFAQNEALQFLLFRARTSIKKPLDAVPHYFVPETSIPFSRSRTVTLIHISDTDNGSHH